MSLVVKIVIPIVIIASLIWLYMTKYPSMVAQTQAPTPSQEVEPAPVPPAHITTDAQLGLDLSAADAELKTATDASSNAQSFTDTPIAQTE